MWAGVAFNGEPTQERALTKRLGNRKLGQFLAVTFGFFPAQTKICKEQSALSGQGNAQQEFAQVPTQLTGAVRFSEEACDR